MSTDLFVAPLADYASQSDLAVRSTAMSQFQYQLVKEMHRERLRQAERFRLHRTALRARRALARSLMR
ncbi:MAG TPA: hypothetical protein VGZ32_08235 [Actinocrinis sp.]|jgi:hypothetical protein|uniref:hypothetical protein n=1 Tax=Actinocrinis sp. TaxID=1920516 RepID=UPI002DDCB6AD|nr:hypothetical protein [Actinocrinis sp.]HEV3170312.1 hypothetical protein [Actinocrinis sp.]